MSARETSNIEPLRLKNPVVKSRTDGGQVSTEFEVFARGPGDDLQSDREERERERL